MSSNLVVPLIIWGRQAPTHCISSILMTTDQRHIVTGCNDGQLCVWDIGSTDNHVWQVHPQTMLFGHNAAVTCLAVASINTCDNSFIVSSADNGEMCLWDLSDGRCLENTRLPIVHTSVQSCQLLQCGDTRLVCNGYYPEIHVMHPRRLEILFSLCAQIQPDWISALCILRPVNREDDVVVAVTSSGVVKVWTIQGSSDVRIGLQQQIFEDESKQIRCLNAQTLRCCAYNQRTVLVVCSKYWQIYDAVDFSLLCSESSRRGERWTGGEFISVDRIVVWSNEGRGYLYKLPTNSSSSHSVNPVSDNFRQSVDPSSPKQMGPLAYSVLDIYAHKPLECSPIMTYVLGRREREVKLLLRGDCEGRLAIWNIPDVNGNNMKLARQESFENLPVVQPNCSTSLREEWSKVDPAPEGILDHLNFEGNTRLQVTASVYMPSQGKLACGRDNGSIILVSAAHVVVQHLLDCVGQDKEVPPHQILLGHVGRVTCLLYAHNESARYDPNILVSGGSDFSVCVWDIVTGTRVHKFCVHGGEILQLLVPPEACSMRVQSCVCAVASDHSLSLLSLRENKCILMASRHLFPIETVKWRPNDDFVVIGCTDGTVHVWQMETGHLDRVVHGITAEEILDTCDEKMDASAGERLSNPTISIAQAFRRHNLATFRHMANQQIQRAQDALEPKMMRTMHPSLVQRVQSSAPFMVQGLRTNTRDPDSHVVYFDTEALIVQLLSEEYAALSPDTLEALGFYTSVAKDIGLSDTQKKVFDLISKVKEKAENVGQTIQARVDGAGIKMPSPRVSRRSIDGSSGGGSTPTSGSQRPSRNSMQLMAGTHALVKDSVSNSTALTVAQILMSCLHAWGLDSDLDQLCINKLGLLRPRRPIAFGFLSRTGGYMSLSLPGWYRHFNADDDSHHSMSVTALATAGHWQLSSAVTTQHLLAVISVANTLMSMSNATFVNALRSIEPHAILLNEADASNQSQTKQGWSLLAAMHCVMLPDLIGRNRYKSPLVEMLARRWQDRCLEIREAAQALLLAELRRINVEGRRAVVEQWSPYLPSNVDPSLSLLSEAAQPSGSAGHSQTSGGSPGSADTQDLDEEEADDTLFGGNDTSATSNKQSAIHESRRKQATAIVMMGVIGAEFGASLEAVTADRTNVAEGFGLTNYAHARHTSKALTFLLLQPPSSSLPAQSLLRRAAVDLLGRGFAVWEMYLDISTVLLGLLELCVDGDALVPSMTCGLPLSSKADACRTARHSLALIATARPSSFIITMAKEVARYNALAQNAQAQHHHHQLQNSVLVRGRPEILHIIELLVEKIPNDVAELLVEVMDVTVHCLNHTVIKNKGLQEAFPAICRFCMVSYCAQSRRICVGAKNGSIAFYDLKQNKCQILPAHGGGVNAVAFSPDAKILASYSYNDSKLLFWQTASSSIFGIGSQQTKCVKTFTTPPVRLTVGSNPLKLVRLVWIDSRTVALLLADGTETRYRV